MFLQISLSLNISHLRISSLTLSASDLRTARQPPSLAAIGAGRVGRLRGCRAARSRGSVDGRSRGAGRGAQMGHRGQRDGLVPAADTDDGFANTQLSVVSEGGRVSVVDNTALWPVGEDRPCATVRVTLYCANARSRSPKGSTIRPMNRWIPLDFRCAAPTPSTADPGSWTRWKPAPAMTPPGSGCSIRSSTAPGWAAGRRARAGRLDPRHRAAVPERGGGPQSQPDGSAVQAAARRMGRRSRADPMATGRRDRNREDAACCSTSMAKSAYGSRCR